MITGNRFKTDKNHYLIDIQTGKKCKGKIYNHNLGQYSDELTYIKMIDGISDFNISIPTGEIWVTKGNTSLYGCLSFSYFGEKSSQEYELYNSLVQNALFGNLESAVELTKKLASTFYTEEEINLIDSKLKDYGVRVFFISQLINSSELQFKFIQQGAYKGEVICQAELAHYYENGYMVEQNYKLAIQWYKKAANNKNIEAMSRLGQLYHWGVIPDLKKSFYWLKRASEHGNYFDYEYLVESYVNGIGCKKNYEKAIYWSKKICKLEKAQIDNCCENFGRILYRLGYYYYYGLGCKKNRQIAYKYFCKSAKEYYWQAYATLSYFYESGIIVQKNTKKAEELLKKRDESIKKDIRNELLRQDCYVIASKTKTKNNTDLAIVMDAGDSFNYHEEQGVRALWLKELCSQENIKIFEDDILAEYIYKHGSEKLKEIILCWKNQKNINFKTKDLIGEIIKVKGRDFVDFISSYL